MKMRNGDDNEYYKLSVLVKDIHQRARPTAMENLEKQAYENNF